MLNDKLLTNVYVSTEAYERACHENPFNKFEQKEYIYYVKSYSYENIFFSRYGRNSHLKTL